MEDAVAHTATVFAANHPKNPTVLHPSRSCDILPCCPFLPSNINVDTGNEKGFLPALAGLVKANLKKYPPQQSITTATWTAGDNALIQSKTIIRRSFLRTKKHRLHRPDGMISTTIGDWQQLPISGV
jgi:hypothetical protein